MEFQEPEVRNVRRALADGLFNDFRSIPEDSFSARLRLEYIRKYRDRECWDAIGDEMLFDIDRRLALLVPAYETDELAKRFDLLMYSIMLSCAQGAYNEQQNRRLVSTCEALAQKGSVERVRSRADVIRRVLDPAYWTEADIPDHEGVRVSLRDLLGLIDYEGKAVYYTDFLDKILSTKEGAPLYSQDDLRSYRLKVESYLRDHHDDTSVHKLRHNERLSATDIRHLEDVLWRDLGTEDDYRTEYRDEPLVRLVARLVGMDRAAADRAFGEFLSDNSLNSNQMDFVQLVVNHIVENGFLDKAALYDPPFSYFGDLSSLFDGRIDTIQGIVKRIDALNGRLDVA